EPVRHLGEEARGLGRHIEALAAPGPTLERARDEPLGLAERVEADGRTVYAMDGDECRNEHIARRAGKLRLFIETRAVIARDGETGPIIDELEGHADDALVLAEVKALGRQRMHAPQTRQNAMLAAHIVRAGRQVAARRPPEYEPASSGPQAIVNVGEARAK